MIYAFVTMTVYIEYVFANNFAFDFVLLWSTVKIAKLKTSKTRFFCAVLSGTVVAIVLPLCSFGILLSVLSKLCLSLGIVWVLGGAKSKKHFFAIVILFWSLTFGMGGVLVCIYFCAGQNFALQNDLSLVSDSPFLLYIAGILVFGFVTKTLVDFLKSKKTNDRFEYDVTLHVGKERFVAKGFLDSGNQLCDDQSGLPVVIVTSQKLQKFFGDKIADQLLSKCGLLKNPHYTKFATLSGGVQKMIVFGIDGFFVDNKEYDVMIGLGNKSAFDCDLLLNAKTFF